MSLKPVIAGFAIAAVFWFFMFSPFTAGMVNFWLLMTLAAGILTVIALAGDRDQLAVLYAFKGRWILVGLVAAAGLYALFFVGNRLSTMIFDFAGSQVTGIYSTRSQASPFLIGSLLLFWIGPSEEIFWRGFAQRRMALKLGPWKGFAVTTAVYALIHLSSFNFMLFMASLICGIFWGLMYMRFNSVWPCLISHAVWDVAIFVLFPLQ